MKALVLRVGEPPALETLSDNIDDHLEEVQGIVGGWVESVPSPYPGVVVLVNEEGLMHRLPTNGQATLMLGHALVGNVVIVGDGGIQWTDVPRSFLNRMDLWPFPVETP